MEQKSENKLLQQLLVRIGYKMIFLPVTGYTSYGKTTISSIRGILYTIKAAMDVNRLECNRQYGTLHPFE